MVLSEDKYAVIIQNNPDLPPGTKANASNVPYRIHHSCHGELLSSREQNSVLIVQGGTMERYFVASLIIQ
jgi:hypothetical protein